MTKSLEMEEREVGIYRTFIPLRQCNYRNFNMSDNVLLEKVIFKCVRTMKVILVTLCKDNEDVKIKKKKLQGEIFLT